MDQGKASWPYIRKVLQSKQQRGITSLAEWERWESERERRKQHGSVTSYPPNESGKAADEKWGIRSALVVGD
jgi:DNA replication protein DnaD